MANLQLKRLNTKQLGFPLDSREALLLAKDLAWLIDISEILHQLSNGELLQQTAPEFRNAHIKMQLAQAETELDKTEQQLGVNLLSFEYRDRNHDAMVFQVGVNLPVGTKFKAAESQYALNSAQAQLFNNLTKLEQLLADIKTEINWLAEELSLLDIHIQGSQKKLHNDYAKRQPLLAINLRKQIIELNRKRGDIQQKVLHMYVSYLTQSGALVKQPLQNWIKHVTPEIETRARYWHVTRDSIGSGKVWA